MSTSSSCAFPKLELTSSSPSTPLRYIEGRGNSPYQTLSPSILFHCLTIILPADTPLSSWLTILFHEQSLVLFSPSGKRKMGIAQTFGKCETLWAPGGAGVQPARWEVNLNTLITHRTISCECFVSMSNFRWFSWLAVPESFIPFHIQSQPSSPLLSKRPRWSKCLTFEARMYYFKAPVPLSTGVLVYWFSMLQCRCAPFYPVNVQFVCSWPQVL